MTYAAYPGEAPVLSGGRVIGDWTVTEHNGKTCWKASLGEVAEGKWHFTPLFVNGVRRARTRRPQEGYFRFADLPEGRHGMFHRVRSAGFNAGEVSAAWRNLGDVDVVTLQHWFDSHLKLAELDESAQDHAVCEPH